MKITHPLVFLTAFCFFIAIFQQPSLASSKKGEFLIQMLKKDPNSEQYRYEYANLLYQEQQFDSALVQLDYLLKINPNNSKGKRLKTNIEEVRAISDSKLRKKRMLDIAMGELNESLNDMNKVSEDLLGSFAPGMMDKHQAEETDRQRLLDQKYKISESAESCDPFDKEILEFEIAGLRYRSEGMKEEAIKTYRQGLEKKESAKMRLGIIGLLFTQGKFEETSQEVAKAMTKFPKDVRFLIYQEGLMEMKSIVSSESKNVSQAATSERIRDAEEILSDSCRKPKK